MKSCHPDLCPGVARLLFAFSFDGYNGKARNLSYCIKNGQQRMATGQKKIADIPALAPVSAHVERSKETGTFGKPPRMLAKKTIIWRETKKRAHTRRAC